MTEATAVVISGSAQFISGEPSDAPPGVATDTQFSVHQSAMDIPVPRARRLDGAPKEFTDQLLCHQRPPRVCVTTMLTYIER